MLVRNGAARRFLIRVHAVTLIPQDIAKYDERPLVCKAELETVDGSVTRFLHSHLLDVYIHGRDAIKNCDAERERHKKESDQKDVQEKKRHEEEDRLEER
jgi:hypothetical protein